MNQPSVISVNPGKRTIGAIKEEGRRYDILSGRLAATIARKSQFKEIVNFIFGIDSKSVYAKSVPLAISRLVTGIALTAICLMHFAKLPLPVAITACVAGVSIALGFFQRIIGIASSAAFAIFTNEGIFYSPLGEEVTTIVGFSIAASLLILALIGPGMFSIDQLMRRALNRNHRKRLRKMALKRTASRSANSQKPLTYKSYFEIS